MEGLSTTLADNEGLKEQSRMCGAHSSVSIACFIGRHTNWQVINTVSEGRKKMASTDSCNISFSYKSTQDLQSLLNFAWGSELAVLLVHNSQSQGKEERLGVIKSRYLKRKVGKEPPKKEKESQNKSGVINKKMFVFFFKESSQTHTLHF